MTDTHTAERIIEQLKIRAEAAEARVAELESSGDDAIDSTRGVNDYTGSDAEFLREALQNAEGRIKALEAHILRLESDARTAKRVREAIVSEVLKALEPYRRV